MNESRSHQTAYSLFTRIFTAGAFALALLLPARPATAGPNAYITNYSDGSVSVIDTATNSLIAVIPGFNGPYGVGVNSAGSLAFIGNQNGNSVSVISGTSVIANVPGINFPSGVAVHPGRPQA